MGGARSDVQITGLSGTSGGAICAYLAWRATYAIRRGTGDCARALDQTVATG